MDRLCAQCFVDISQLTTTLRGNCYDFPNFADAEAEAQPLPTEMWRFVPIVISCNCPT